MNTGSNRETVKTAFALGGLGASNFHGLGVLQAALDRNLVPDMISCTSGQIHAVWKYLKIKNYRRHGQDAKDLEDVAKTYMQEAEIRPSPATGEFFEEGADLVSTWVKHFADLEAARANPVGWSLNVFANWYPARIFVPNIKPGTLEEICEDFQSEEDIAISFNSYDPRQGSEHVYVNKRAQELLGRKPQQLSSFRNAAYHHTTYMEITPQAVMDALWLYEYGFKERLHVDGSYFRMIMLSELSRAEKIFVVRPIEYQWSGPMPITVGEKDDLKTEIFFNSSYYGERFRIEIINRLIDEQAFTKEYMDRSGYHKVDFYEIEPRTPKPFVGYFSESMDMFYEARSDALNKFEAALG